LRNPVYELDQDRIPEYEVLELSPAELDSLLQEVHSPAVDHVLYPAEYDWEDRNQEDTIYPGYYPLTLPDYLEEEHPEQQLHNLGFLPQLGEVPETNQNLFEALSHSTTTTAPSTTIASTTSTTTTARPLLTMTKERRGMFEEPIFRPGNAKDPHFMYRGRKKRSIPLPPFVSKTNKS